MDEVTVLEAIGSNKLTKVITKQANGSIHKSDYDNARQFHHKTIDVDNIQDLSLVLTALEDMQHSCIIRGELIPGIDPNKIVLRRKDAFDGDIAYYQEKAIGRRWACFDFDGIPTLDGLSNTAEYIEYLVYLLGKEFENKSYHYQWSSSAGLEGWDQLRCHLWFWLETPRTDTEMIGWARLNGNVDEAPFRTVQANYTAKPVFKNMEDPIERRSGLIERDEQAVLVPIAPMPVSANYKNTGSGKGGSLQERLDEIGPRYHMPIQQAICHYVGVNGSRTDIPFLKAELKAAIQTAPPGQTPKDYYLNDRYLDHCIKSAMRKYGTHTPTDLTLLRRKIKNLH